VSAASAGADDEWNTLAAMCRSIKTLRGSDPPATAAEIEAAALQFVRKVSGYRHPSARNREVFEWAVAQVAGAVSELLEGVTVQPAAAAREH
jgi:hypothetical protein